MRGQVSPLALALSFSACVGLVNACGAEAPEAAPAPMASNPAPTPDPSPVPAKPLSGEEAAREAESLWRLEHELLGVGTGEMHRLRKAEALAECAELMDVHLPRAEEADRRASSLPLDYLLLSSASNHMTRCVVCSQELAQFNCLEAGKLLARYCIERTLVGSMDPLSAKGIVDACKLPKILVDKVLADLVEDEVLSMSKGGYTLRE